MVPSGFKRQPQIAKRLSLRGEILIFIFGGSVPSFDQLWRAGVAEGYRPGAAQHGTDVDGVFAVVLDSVKVRLRLVNSRQ